MKWIVIAMLTLVISANQIPTVQLNESTRVGGIEFTPLAVEVRPIKLRRPAWTSDEFFKSTEQYLVLTYRLSNVTEEQAIDPSVLQGLMEDQFGNVHHQVFGFHICPNCIIDEPGTARELLPGDSQRLVAVFQAPKIAKAELFTVKVSFVKDNQNRRGEVWVMFKRADLRKTD